MTAAARRHPPPLKVGEIVEIVQDHPHGGSLAMVREVRSWGCIADLHPAAGGGVIRLHDDEIIRASREKP